MNDFKELPILVLEENNMPGNGLGVQATNVSRSQHELISGIMGDNCMDSQAYTLRRECNAFFQGGSNDPDGGWVYLEFWSIDLTAINTFLAYVNYSLGQLSLEMPEDVFVARYTDNMYPEDNEILGSYANEERANSRCYEEFSSAMRNPQYGQDNNHKQRSRYITEKVPFYP